LGPYLALPKQYPEETKKTSQNPNVFGRFFTSHHLLEGKFSTSQNPFAYIWHNSKNMSIVFLFGKNGYDLHRLDQEKFNLTFPVARPTKGDLSLDIIPAFFI